MTFASDEVIAEDALESSVEPDRVSLVGGHQQQHVDCEQKERQEREEGEQEEKSLVATPPVVAEPKRQHVRPHLSCHKC